MSKPSDTRPDHPADDALWDSVDRLLLDWHRERPDLDFSPVGVVTRLLRLRAHLDSGLQRVFDRYDLTHADFQVIVALRRAGTPYRLTQAALMNRLVLTSGTISVRVNRLVARGVVVREPDPGDRRVQLVRLTEDGLRLFDQVAPVHLANEDRLLSALTHDERDRLTDLLRRLLISFESGTVEVGLPLGMRLEPAHLARRRRTAVGLTDAAGLLVTEIIAGTPAAEAGLARGDLLVAAAGRELRSDAALAEEIEAARESGRLRLTLLRGNERQRVDLELPAVAAAVDQAAGTATPGQP
jgi:DNA-binding MarR family transcriptional regulator